MWDAQPVSPDHHEDEAYDPFGPDPLGHICTTYNIDNPRPGECPAHGEGWRGQPHYCHEHREWHMAGEAHDECEACEIERNTGRTLTDEELLSGFPGMTGSLCDDHLREEMYEE